MRFTDEIDERFELDAELARVEEEIAVAFATPQPVPVVTVASAVTGPAEVAVSESTPGGWFRRLFGRGRGPETPRETVMASDDVPAEPEIVPADIGRRVEDSSDGPRDDAEPSHVETTSKPAPLRVSD